MATFKYPFTASKGTLVLSDDNKANGEAIAQAIQTHKGERVLRNYFGVEVEELSTLTQLGALLGSLEKDIAEATAEYQPLTLTLEGSMNDDGTAQVTCEYNDLFSEGTVTVTLW